MSGNNGVGPGKNCQGGLHWEHCVSLSPLPHSETTCTVWGLRVLWPLITRDAISLRKAFRFLSGLRISNRALLFHGTLSCVGGGGNNNNNICSRGTTKKETHSGSKKKYTLQMSFNSAWKCALMMKAKKKNIQSNRLTWVVVCEWGKLVADCISMPVCVYSCKFACTHTQCFGSLVPVNISVTFPLCFIRLAFVF